MIKFFILSSFYIFSCYQQNANIYLLNRNNNFDKKFITITNSRLSILLTVLSSIISFFVWGCVIVFYCMDLGIYYCLNVIVGAMIAFGLVLLNYWLTTKIIEKLIKHVKIIN